MKKNWFNSFLLCFLLVSCLEEEQIERSYPKVMTSAVTEISSSGALFSGLIESGDLAQIIEYGFVWGEDDELQPENSFSLSFETAPTKSVSAQIQSTLQAHITYYVRFYIKTDAKTIYGNLVEFVSLGSEGPVITSLAPGSGALGDTILIRGRNFITQRDRIVVKFDVVETPIITATDTSLVVSVPRTIRVDNEEVPVSVSVLGNVRYAPNPFVLELDRIIPSITSVYPLSVKACDTITVVGKNFRSMTDWPAVVFPNSFESLLIKATDDSIQFAIKLLPPGELKFNILFGNYELAVPVDFEELRPQFVSVSPAIYDPGGIMTVKVKNFPTCLPIVASVGGYGAQVLHQSEDEVQIRIMEGCYGEGSQMAFGVNYYSYFLYSPAIPSQPSRILSVEPNHGKANQEVVIRGENIVDPNQYNAFLSITSFTDTEIRGTVIPPYGFYAPDGYVDVTVNMCGMSVTLPHGFRFDPPAIIDFNPKVVTSADQIITIEGENFSAGFANMVLIYGDTPMGNDRLISQEENRITFRAGDLIAGLNDPAMEVKFSAPITVRTSIGMEVTTAANLTVNHDGPWKKIDDFPGPARYGAISFSAGGKGYVGLGRAQNNTAVGDLWEFDPTTEDWTRKAGFPAHYNGIDDAVVIHDKAYILSLWSQLWEYNPAADAWTQKTDFPGHAASQMVVMGINNKMYVGGGYYNGAESTEFWEYDPTLNTWSRKADSPGGCSSYSPFYQAGGKGYMFNGIAPKRRFIYDPVANSWQDEPFNTFTESGPWKVIGFGNYSIVIGSPPGYLEKNLVYKMTPGSNSLTPLPYAGPSRSQAVGFSIGETGYYGLGGYLGDLKDFWKFDPSKF